MSGRSDFFSDLSPFSHNSVLRQSCLGLWNSRKLQVAKTQGKRSYSNRVGVALQEVSTCWLLSLSVLPLALMQVHIREVGSRLKRIVNQIGTLSKPTF